MRDVVIIGGGHNGLVCAAYLAMAGLKVTRAGAARTSSAARRSPRNSSRASATRSPPTRSRCSTRRSSATWIWRAHGLRIVERRVANFLPLDDGRYLQVGGGRTQAEVAKFSDTRRRAARRLSGSASKRSPTCCARSCWRRRRTSSRAAGARRLPELLQVGAASASGCASLDCDLRRDLLDLFTNSAGDYLDGWFESDPIKAAYGFDGIVGNYASPYTPGSAYVLLHHVLRRGERQEGRLGPRDRRHGRDHAGDGEVRAAARGVEIRVRRRVREVIVEKGRAVGVVTEAGETIRARAVVSNLNPKLLYLQLIDPAALAAGFPRAHRELALRLGHVPHERGALRAAGFHLPARPRVRRASHRRHHHRAEPCLHGAGLFRRAHASAGRGSRSSRC